MQAQFPNVTLAVLFGTALSSTAVCSGEARGAAPARFPAARTPGHACKPVAPVEAMLHLIPPSRPGEPATLLLSARAEAPMPAPEIRWQVPPQGVLTRGLPAVQQGSPLTAGQAARFGGQVVFTRPGLFSFRASFLQPGPTATWGREASLTVRVGADGRAQVLPAVLGDGERFTPPAPQSLASAPARIREEVPPHSARIRGRVRYRDHQGQLVPARNMLLEVVDRDGLSGDDRLDFLACDVNGEFVTRWFDNRDGAGAGNQDPQIRVLSESRACAVHNPDDGKLWEVRRDLRSDIPDGEILAGTIDIDTSGPAAYPDDGVEGAYEIVVNAAHGFNHAGQWFNRAIRSDVYWKPGRNVESHYDPGTKRIDLADGDQFDRDVLTHEIGHLVMDRIKGQLPPESDAPFSFLDHNSQGWAWSEGWATFYALVCQGPPTGIYTDEPGFGDTSSIRWNVEQNTGAAPGDTSAASVSGALWDIYDSLGNDPHPNDALGKGAGYVEGVFLNSGTLFTILDFLNEVPAADRPRVEGIYGDHHILPGRKVDTSAALDDAIGYIGRPVTLSARIRRASDSAYVPNAAVTFLVNGQTAGIATAAGFNPVQLTYRLPATLVAGTYPIRVLFAGNDLYNPSSAQATLTVRKVPVTLTLNPASGRLGDNVLLQANMKDGLTGTGVAGSVRFTLPGGLVRVGNGSAVARVAYAISATATGNLPYTAEFLETAVYAPATAAGTVTVQLPNARLAVEAVTAAAGQTVQLKARLTDLAGAPLAGRSVRFQVDRNTGGTGITDGTGTAAFAYLIRDFLAPGAHEIEADFTDATHYARQGKAALAIVKAGTRIEVPAATGRTGQAVTLAATLKRTTDGAGVSLKTLRFTLQGVVIGNVATNGSGVATLTYTVPATLGTGAKTLVVDFLGDTRYIASQGRTTLTVSP